LEKRASLVLGRIPPSVSGEHGVPHVACPGRARLEVRAEQIGE
jgi:hypothetical protein